MGISSSSSGSSLDDAPPKKTPSRDLTPQYSETPIKTKTLDLFHSTPVRSGLDQSNNLTLLGFNDSLAPVHPDSSPQFPPGQGTPTPYQSFENVSATGSTGDISDLDITVLPSNSATLGGKDNPDIKSLGTPVTPPLPTDTIDVTADMETGSLPLPPISVNTTEVSEGQLTRLCNALSQADDDITPAQRIPSRQDEEDLNHVDIGHTSLIDLETEIDSLYEKYVGPSESAIPKFLNNTNKQVSFKIPVQEKSDKPPAVSNNALSLPLQDRNAPDSLDGALDDDGHDILAPDEKLNLPHVVEEQWKNARKGLVKANRSRARATHLRDLCTTLDGDIPPAQPPWVLGLEGLPAYIAEDASLVKVVVEHRRQSGFDLMSKLSRELFRRAAQQTECSVVTLCQAREVAVKEGVDNFTKAVMLMARVVGREKAKTKFQLSKRRAWYLQHQPTDKDLENFHLFSEASFRSKKKESGGNNNKNGISKPSSSVMRKKSQKTPSEPNTPTPVNQDFPSASSARTPQGQSKGRQGRRDQQRQAAPLNKETPTPTGVRGRKRSNSRRRNQRRSRSRSRSTSMAGGAQQRNKSARTNQNNTPGMERPQPSPVFNHQQWMEMAQMMPPFQFPYYPMMFPPGYGTGLSAGNSAQNWTPRNSPPKKGKGRGNRN